MGKRRLGWVLLRRLLVAAAALTLLGPGCSSRAMQATGDAADDAGSGDGARHDRDGDGLCDLTEPGYGADPDVADTDGDGLPDFVEVQNDFDPVASSSPVEDQVGQLQARRGATLDLPVRATVNAEGEGLSGVFEPITPFFHRPPGSIEDFFVQATAVSADPLDHVRGIDHAAERFELVQGETRLGFTLRFEYPFEAGLDCANSYPFRYRIKNDSGETVSERRYLVVVAPAGAPGAPRHCPPRDCY